MGGRPRPSHAPHRVDAAVVERVVAALGGVAAASASCSAARATLGFGQAIDDPASTSLLADAYPAQVRGRVFSVQQVTSFVGAGIGIGLGGVVGGAFGWQWAFALVGMPGSILAFAGVPDARARGVERPTVSTYQSPSGCRCACWLSACGPAFAPTSR